MLESITKFFSLSLLELSVYDLVILVLFSLSLILTLIFALIVIATKVRKLNNDIDSQINEQISNEKAIINYLDVIMNHLSKEKIDVKSNVEIREDIQKQDTSKINEIIEKNSFNVETISSEVKSDSSKIVQESKPEVASRNLTISEPKKNSLVLLEDEIKNIPLERQKILENVAENINTLSALEQVSQQIENKIKETEQKESVSVQNVVASTLAEAPKQAILRATESTTKVSTTTEDVNYNTSRNIGNVINVDPIALTQKMPEVQVDFNNRPNSLSQEYHNNTTINNQIPELDVISEPTTQMQQQQLRQQGHNFSESRTRPNISRPALSRTEPSERIYSSVRPNSTRQMPLTSERLRPTRFLGENAIDKGPNFNNNFNNRINRDNINDSVTSATENRFHFKPVSLNLLNRTNEINSVKENNLIGSNIASYNEEGRTNMYNNAMNRSMANRSPMGSNSRSMNNSSMGGMNSMNNRSMSSNNRPAMGGNMNRPGSMGNSSFGANPMGNMGGMGSMNNRTSMNSNARPAMGGNNRPTMGGNMNRQGSMGNSSFGANPMSNMGGMKPANATVGASRPQLGSAGGMRRR